MENNASALFRPITIGGLTVRNRTLLCPMEGTTIIRWLFGKGFDNSKKDFYLERADDGVGILIPGTCPLKSLFGDKWLWKHPEVFKPVKPFMDELHAHGGVLFLQLTAGWGRSLVMNQSLGKVAGNSLMRKLAKPVVNLDNMLIAPDDGEPNVWMPEFQCRQITRQEIQEYVTAYAETAWLAKQAGIDGVEVHAVHEGYLMDQFTMPYTNHRTDEYGGSFENRYRFAVEVVKAIKERCGADYPVSLRYSVVSKTKGFNSGAVPGEVFHEVGRDMEESERAIALLSDAGYDMFNCDNGTYDAWYWAHPPVYMPLNCNLEDVIHIKQFTGKPVYCAGRMQIEDGAKAVQEGKLDGVAIGRQFLTDRHFLTKFREGRLDEVKPCISCHTGCLPMAHYQGVGLEFPNGDMQTGYCALCPRTLKEKKYPLVQARHPRHIAVIGGGIGGMETAIQAAMRGHRVDLYEKTEELGGTFLAAAAPSFKEKDRDLIAWYRAELARWPIAVHMGMEIHHLSDIAADEYVIATGGEPKTLPIPGWEKTVNAEDWLRGRKSVGDKVAVIGGGITGCEVAYELALQGRHPLLVETMDDLMKTMMVPAANSMLLRDLIRYHKIPVYLEARTTDIRDNGITIQQNGKRLDLEADSVIVSVGYRSVNTLAEKPSKYVHVIGDAAEVANLKHAIWGANDLVVSLSRA